jgi:hypothetical protein
MLGSVAGGDRDLLVPRLPTVVLGPRLRGSSLRRPPGANS